MTLATRRIAVLGTPSRPEADWSTDALRRLRADGFTGIQLNIAWSYRPLDEPLSLEDIISVDGAPESRADPDTPRSQRRDQMARRAEAAHEAHLRTFLHVGLPYQGRAGFEGAGLPQCISDPDVLDRYVDALGDLTDALPHLDDLLIYTYDQDAWLCSEFEGCPNCAGVALPDRLVPFLNRLASAWRAKRADGRLWWEPWELTAGQALATVTGLDGDTIGLMVHSNIGEVMTTAPADVFLHNIAAVASARGIPVVAEVFLSSSNEEVEPWRHLPVPLCTIAQLRAINAVPGITGVKEYFGLSSSDDDVNTVAAVMHLNNPESSDPEILARVADRWGHDWLSGFWTKTSAAYRLYPWDLSWFTRQLGHSSPAHALTAATLRGTQTAAAAWDTPAWRASRRGVFIRVTNEPPHPWQLDDARHRFRLAADVMRGAVDLATSRLARSARGAAAERIEHQVVDATRFVIRCTAYECHIEETLLAARARTEEDPAVRSRILSQLDLTLARDIENVRHEMRLPALSTGRPPTPLQLAEKWVIELPVTAEPLKEARRELLRDPDGFLSHYFLEGPHSAPAGQFSLTSA
ncbi:hypothetical protein [Microbacterium radiodurans]|uniref:Uncharacterized protein n=1 Tax=Microbacterium radiodurans TaxID=661398 RepID=A0A5J5IMN0_9MICO|nr:hypothetical protein [Microbacterium radiodurans]KAA9083749.1 hypothetical protein F6B42_14450 [Microbacterium radiodurans]